MKRFYLFLITFCLGTGFTTALPGAETVPTQLEEEFRLVLLRLAQSGELPDTGSPVVIERPAERVSDFGLLVDRDNADGLLVLGTLPGGSAERLGLRAGDRLLTANDVDLRGRGGSQRMREFLDNPDSSGRVDLRVLREGREQQLAGSIDSVSLPAMRVVLTADTVTDIGADTERAGHVPGDPQSSCGRVTTLSVAPRSRNLFPARLINVDGEIPGTSGQQTYRLTPGRHALLVAEAIEPEQFSGIANMQRGRRSADNHKLLEVDIQPGVTYFLAARFHRDRSDRILEGTYWQPVLWKERAESCR